MENTILRQTEVEDLEFFYKFQLDEEARILAAFTSKESTDKIAYLKKYTKLLNDSTVNMKTILINNTIVGSISKFELQGKAEITYWIDRRFWRKGVASTALKEFLNLENCRPIFGRVAFDNFGSQIVLEKSGFKKVGRDQGFANERQIEIEEYIYKLT